MSGQRFEQGLLWGPRETEPDMYPEPYPWCLACGFQHTPDTHCAECNGDHFDGHCMTDELAAALARQDQLDKLWQRIEKEAEALLPLASALVHVEGYE